MKTWDGLIKIRNRCIRTLYKGLIKPVLFKMDPEFVHDGFILAGRLLGSNPLTRALTRLLFDYSHPLLERTVAGIHFKNPIGLSAGFDKNAQLTKIIPCVGFGFMEVGSVTGEPCAGNPKPRLWRHPELQSIRVYYGLMNDGCRAIAKRLTGKHFAIPVGINVAKTNNEATCEVVTGVLDYAKAFKTMKDCGAYITVNLSCPNAFGGQPFTDPIKLEKLLQKLDSIPTKKPIFLKLSPDMPTSELDKLLAISQKHRVHGFVCTNLTKKHDFGNGGLSGKAVADLSLAQIRHIHQKTKDSMAIIACGGIFTAEDAWQRLEAGASLLELITGMIFEGPQLISTINQGLVERIEGSKTKPTA
jgi:dihydroorotate dehydrogenase